jgi:hypothetical protein
MGRFVRVVLASVVATVVATVTTATVAADLRCDESLVARGLTPFEVLERCGSPEFEMRFADYRYPGIVVHVDEWTYDLGHNKFRRLLTFENGRLVRIEVRDKPKRSVGSMLATDTDSFQ